MSLAATLSADGMRPASFLPAIKCSDCGQEIEIARMGDHVCGSRGQLPASLTPGAPRARPTPPPLANPYTMPSWGTNNQQYRPPSPTSHSPVSTRMATASFAPSPLAQAQAPPAVPQTHPVALTPASRLPPPRINADVANAPFLAPQFPNSGAPSSPIGSVRSGRSGSSNSSRPPNLRALMNMPSPLVRNRSPSPDYAPNLDCAFPSFPTSSSNAGSRPGTSNGRSTPNSDRTPSRAGSRARLRVDKDVQNMEPRSPRTTAGGDILKRANTLKSGPFDAGRRTGSREEKPSMPSKSFGEAERRPSNVSERPELTRQTSNFSQSGRRPSEPTQKPALSQLPESNTATLQPFAFVERRPSDSSGRPSFSDDERGPHSRNGSPPPADFFEHRGRSPLTAQDSASIPAPLRIGDRSKTFPAPNEAERPAVTRTETEPVTRGRRPSLASSVRSEQPFPIRSSSRSRTRINTRTEEIPPVPKPVQHYRQLSKHAPSESASSASSTTRSFSNANSSEGPSPVGSAASSIDAFSPISQANIYDKEERPKSERMRSAGYSTKNEQRNPGLRAEQPAQRSPPPNFARPRPSAAGAAGLPSMAALVESPMDGQSPEKRDTSQQLGFDWGLPSSTPARSASPPKTTPPTQSGENWTPGWGNLAPVNDDYDPYRAPSPNPATRARSKSNASSVYPTDEPRPSMPPPLPSDAMMPRALSRRNTTVRAPCRGCGEIIEGKSVKAADGRLTGRWHKHCFTCRTCRQPFATADFYVINNQPYCKQHWHEQNGSVCHGCKRGIEGQYLETSASGPEKKYHPTCFTCHECRLILSNDYFEIGGHAYCERHAMHAMRGQPPRAGGPGAYGRGGYGNPSGLHPGRREMMGERRTTKLMMM